MVAFTGKPKRLPTGLTPSEVRRAPAQLTKTYLLMARLLCGSERN